MYIPKYFPIFLLLLSFSVNGQGLILNEYSNGPAGSQEFMEFVVIGSSADPLAPVDLSGWIIDDNNGDFEANTSGKGIASGHFRIASGCLDAVRPGTIILFYNHADPNPMIPAGSLDETDADNDCILILSANSACIERCTSLPSSTSGASYSPCTYATSSIWGNIGLSNTRDAAQVRMPDGAFFHGYCNGLSAPYPTFPASIGGGSSFRVPGSGSNGNFQFNSGSFTDVANFSRVTASSNDSPGTPNNDANRYFINALRNGTYDYTNLNNPINTGTATVLDPCPTLLNIDFDRFEVQKVETGVVLHWEMNNVIDYYYEVERSVDGVQFESIGNFWGKYSNSFELLDEEPKLVNYYRIKVVLADASITYSSTHYVHYTQGNEFVVYPNPVRDIAHIEFERALKEKATVEVFNLFGDLVHQIELPEGTKNVDLNCNQFNSGAYILSIKQGLMRRQYKFVK